MFFNTKNLLKVSGAFGIHPDPFISDDVCCYSQPRFDEAAKLFRNLGGRLQALIMVHFRSPSMNVYGFAYLA